MIISLYYIFDALLFLRPKRVHYMTTCVTRSYRGRTMYRPIGGRAPRCVVGLSASAGVTAGARYEGKYNISNQQKDGGVMRKDAITRNKILWLSPQAVGWRLTANPRIRSEAVSVGFLVDKLALGQAFPRLLTFSFGSIITSMFHTHSSVTNA